MGCGGEMGCFWFQTMVTGERKEVDGWGVCACVCVTATDRFEQTKLGLYCHKYRGDEGGEEEVG